MSSPAQDVIMDFVFFYSLPLAVLAWLGANKKIPGYILYRFILVIFISAVSAITAPVTTDHEIYADAYRKMIYRSYDDFSLSLSEFDRNVGLEPGYMILNLVISKFGVSEAFFFFIIAMIVNSSIIWFIYKYKSPVLSILFLFISGSILINEQNVVRQFVALSVFLYALQFIDRRKPIIYASIIVLGGFFHFSVLFMLPLIYFCFLSEDVLKAKHSGKNAFYFFAFIYIASLLTIFIPGLIPSLLNSLHIAAYANLIEATASVGVVTNYTFIILYNIISFFALLIWHRTNKTLAACAVMMAVFYNLSLSVPPIVRMTFYLSVPATVFGVHYLLHDDKLVGIRYYYAKGGVILYILYMMIANFILSKPVLFDQTYSLSDFF